MAPPIVPDTSISAPGAILTSNTSSPARKAGGGGASEARTGHLWLYGTSPMKSLKFLRESLQEPSFFLEQLASLCGLGAEEEALSFLSCLLAFCTILPCLGAGALEKAVAKSTRCLSVILCAKQYRISEPGSVASGTPFLASSGSRSGTSDRPQYAR